jgi:hypothetical protein
MLSLASSGLLYLLHTTGRGGPRITLSLSRYITHERISPPEIAPIALSRMHNSTISDYLAT